MKKAIESLFSLDINNLKQWILIRGNNIDNPVLLFLSGGPGFTQIPFQYRFHKRLENHFTVINWDQRGAGKSFSPALQAESIHFNQYIDDTVFLINYLRKKFKKHKVFLVGHSWGGVLGMFVINSYPELVHMFAGTGFGVNVADSNRIKYDFVLQKAKSRNDKRALKLLDGISRERLNQTRFISLVDSYVMKYKGMINRNAILVLFQSLYYCLSTKYYSPGDWVSFFKGIKLLKSFGSEFVQNTDLFQEIKSVNVPVYLFLGRKDYWTPWELAEKYLEFLQAPDKKIFWFNYSAHSPIFEEPEKFEKLLCRALLGIDINDG